MLAITLVICTVISMLQSAVRCTLYHSLYTVIPDRCLSGGASPEGAQPWGGTRGADKEEVICILLTSPTFEQI